MNAGLQEFGRERAYFDFRNAVQFGNGTLSVVSGFKASINRYEADRILLCVQATSKLIGKATVMEVFMRCNNHREEMLRKVVGKTAITRLDETRSTCV